MEQARKAPASLKNLPFSISGLHLDDDEFADVLHEGQTNSSGTYKSLEDELFGSLYIETDQSANEVRLRGSTVLDDAATVLQSRVRGYQSRSLLIEDVGMGLHDSDSERDERVPNTENKTGKGRTLLDQKRNSNLDKIKTTGTEPLPHHEQHSWFEQLGLKYVKGGKILKLNSQEIGTSHKRFKAIDDIAHHESKHGGAAQLATRHKSPSKKQMHKINGVMSRKQNHKHGNKDDPDTPPPVGENIFPKQFYTRKNHPTSLSPNPKSDTLKPHVHKAVHAPLERFKEDAKNFDSVKSPRRNAKDMIHDTQQEQVVSVHTTKRKKSAKDRENRRRQHEAFLRLTRSWVKTPCLICNIEGHLMKDCPHNARRKLIRKMRKRTRRFVRPSSARRVRNRLLLSHHSRACSGDSDMHLLPALDPNERERLKTLAFAVKKSLVQAVTWAEQAKLTSKGMERTRQNIRRSARRSKQKF